MENSTFKWNKRHAIHMEERITVNPKVLAGKPVIKSTRIPVYRILNLLANGKTVSDILKDYHELTKEDVVAAVQN